MGRHLWAERKTIDSVVQFVHSQMLSNVMSSCEFSAEDVDRCSRKIHEVYFVFRSGGLQFNSFTYDHQSNIFLLFRML